MLHSIGAKNRLLLFVCILLKAPIHFAIYSSLKSWLVLAEKYVAPACAHLLLATSMENFLLLSLNARSSVSGRWEEREFRRGNFTR